MKLLKLPDVFSLKPGQTVYDEKAKIKGTISDIRESKSECIDAYVIWDGQDKEEILLTWPYIKLVA